MADSLTTNILLTNQEVGGNNNSWGTIANSNFTRIDAKLGATTSISTTGGSTSLTTTQELVAIIKVTGTLVSNVTINFSGRGGFWVIQNATSGAFSVTCKVTGQTGVAIPQGTQRLVFCDGTDIVLGDTQASATAEVTIASAATTDILGAASEFVAISGTATITSLGSAVNTKRFVRATGAFTLTHNATSLILPSGKNITAAAGDTFLVISDASGNARVYTYQRTSGEAVTSSVPIGALLDYGLATLPDSRWLWLDGKTIGSSASGGTARASSSVDTQALFSGLWASYSNSLLPIQDSAGTPTTRGGSAAADFAANKRLPLPDFRGRIGVPADNMGGSAANRMTAANGLDGTILGTAGGEQVHTLTPTEMPVHGHGVNDPGHIHDLNREVASAQTGAGVPALDQNASLGHTTSAASLTGISIQNAGGGAAHNNVQPSIVCNKIIFAGVA